MENQHEHKQHLPEDQRKNIDTVVIKDAPKKTTKLDSPSLLLTLVKTNSSILLIGALCRALRLVFDFLNPLLLQ